MSLFRFLKNELTRDYWLENDQEKFTERRKRVYSFMKIPRELEKFVVFGLLQCFDALLFTFTFLPIRFVKTIFKLLFYLFIKGQVRSADGSCLLNSAEICDILKVLTLVSSFLLLNHVDFSMMYHVIRGQTVIKLYIFFNMLDVADRLCSSFGQDILDSLFWTATGPRRRDHAGVIPHLALAIFYVFLHTILVLLQANTLNVAFNSHNKALLTIMISNNFLELKGSVFKRFEKGNLFQMTCSDVRERCHLTILLSIVVIRNLNQFSWDLDHFWVLLPDIMLVLVCELMVDWIKHAFITKFNEISFDVYREYSLSLAYDIVASRNARAVSDHVDVVSRRMGFIPLPLAALLSRVVFQSASLKSPIHVLNCGVLFLCLLSTKVLLSIILLGYAQCLVSYNRKVDTPPTKKRTPGIQFMVSKDDLNIPKEQSDEKKDGFRRSQSLGQFNKKDQKQEKDYEIILEYSSSSEEYIGQSQEKVENSKLARTKKQKIKNAIKSHSLDDSHINGVKKLSRLNKSSLDSLGNHNNNNGGVDVVNSGGGEDVFSSGVGVDITGDINGGKSGVNVEDGDDDGGRSGFNVEDGDDGGGRSCINVEDGDDDGGRSCINVEDCDDDGGRSGINVEDGDDDGGRSGINVEDGDDDGDDANIDDIDGSKAVYNENTNITNNAGGVSEDATTVVVEKDEGGVKKDEVEKYKGDTSKDGDAGKKDNVKGVDNKGNLEDLKCHALSDKGEDQ